MKYEYVADFDTENVEDNKRWQNVFTFLVMWMKRRTKNAQDTDNFLGHGRAMIINTKPKTER